jgi:hypothetical protein
MHIAHESQGIRASQHTPQQEADGRWQAQPVTHQRSQNGQGKDHDQVDQQSLHSDGLKR